MFSYNQKYIDGLTKTYGFHKEYQFKGKKCSNDCKNLINYETIHSKECPFYEGSFSQFINDFLKFHTPDDRLVEKNYQKFCELRNKYIKFFKK